MLDVRKRRAELRKCALVAALLSVCCVVALEVTGRTLTGSYAGLDGRSGLRATAAPPAGPASATLR